MSEPPGKEFEQYVPSEGKYPRGLQTFKESDGTVLACVWDCMLARYELVRPGDWIRVDDSTNYHVAYPWELGQGE